MTATARKLPVQQPGKKWNYRQWGTLDDPIHKSQVNTLVGEFACTEQFRYDRQRELDGEAREVCSGKTEMGTAGHNTIRRALENPVMRERILSGADEFNVQRIRTVLEQEFAKAVRGRDVNWYGKAEREDELEAKTHMIHGLFRDFHNHVADVLLCEAGFISKLGDFWIEGHTDLAYRPPTRVVDLAEALGLTDWKTGSTKPDQIELDHGWESGFYSAAMRDGLFLPISLMEAWQKLARDDRQELVPLDLWDAQALANEDDERKAMHIALRGLARREVRATSAGKVFDLPEGVVRFGRFPDVIRLTHLADYVPYQKKGDKKVERAEDVEHWSRVTGQDLRPGDKIKYEKGQVRGPAWLPIRRSEDDIPRLEKLLRGVVGWVRFGRFVQSVGEKCKRCSYRGSCLTGGYEARGEEARELAGLFEGVDLSDFSIDNTND